MSLALIYARTENYCIGRDGGLPWSLPKEYEHFNNTTMGSAVIMGRKTYEDHQCELPGRLNIVITRQDNFALTQKVLRASSLNNALEKAKDAQRVFVIGGSDLLREALPLANEVYETVIHTSISGDAFVEPFDFEDWDNNLLCHFTKDEQHQYGYSIYHHLRLDR